MIPCKVYYPRKDKEPKILTANSQNELESLLRIGWKTDDPTQGETHVSTEAVQSPRS